MKNLLRVTFVVVLAINAGILFKAFYNRIDPVVLALDVTERELSPPADYGFGKENSGISLTVNWLVKQPTERNPDDFRYSRTLTLSEEHYASFGFPQKSCKDFNSNSTKAWLLIEFNGPAHQGFIDAAQKYLAKTVEEKKVIETTVKQAEELLKTAEQTSSRLFVIDAARDKTLIEASLAANQEKFGNSDAKYFMLPGLVSRNYYNCDGAEKRSTEVVINQLLTQKIYLPRQFHQGFSKTNRQKNQKLRYQVSLAFGHFYDPWIKDFILTTQ